MRATISFRALCLLLTAIAPAFAEPAPIHSLGRTELEERLAGDMASVPIHREGLRAVITYMDSQPDLFPAGRQRESRLLRREEKEAAWEAWQRFLDYQVALDSIERYHASFHRLRGTDREDSFLIGHAAMLARYASALEFIARAERNPELHKILNEPVPELGLPGGTYARLKFQYLNVAIATEFAAREVLMKTFPGARNPALRESIRTDAAQVWDAGKGRGPLLTARNALRIVQDGAQSAWFPVQAGVAEWSGGIRVYRPGRSLISQAQIRQLQPRLAPGDILLTRREWYLSNIGLPGFWPHAALYIGTPEERRAFFNEPEVHAWVRSQGEESGDFESLLRARYPGAYQESLGQPEPGNPVRVLEAIGKGVSLTSLESSADCDSLAVLRPRLSRRESAQALVRALHYAGRPYDFNFDFATDAELVCTELIYKAYEPASGFDGLNFPVMEMLGRKVMPANELVKQFDRQHDTPEQQFDLILFLDGQERPRAAFEAGADEFRESWKRPKWHILVQQ